MDKRFGVENGYVTTTTIIPVPKQVFTRGLTLSFNHFKDKSGLLPKIQIFKGSDWLDTIVDLRVHRKFLGFILDL